MGNLHKDQMINLLHQAGVVLRKGSDYPEGFILKSGKKSNIYINLRDLIKRPTSFNMIMYCMFDMMSDYNKEDACILGIPTMGAVISPVMAYKLSIPQAVVRLHKKLHGVGNEIEGKLTNRIAIIDDVITSGSSIKEIIQDYIEPKFDQDYELDIFVVVDREEHNLPNVHSLAKLSEVRKWKPTAKTDSYQYSSVSHLLKQ